MLVNQEKKYGAGKIEGNEKTDLATKISHFKS